MQTMELARDSNLGEGKRGEEDRQCSGNLREGFAAFPAACALSSGLRQRNSVKRRKRRRRSADSSGRKKQEKNEAELKDRAGGRLQQFAKGGRLKKGAPLSEQGKPGVRHTENYLSKEPNRNFTDHILQVWGVRLRRGTRKRGKPNMVKSRMNQNVS